MGIDQRPGGGVIRGYSCYHGGMFSTRRLFAQSSILYFPKLLSWLVGYAAFSLIFRMRGAAEYGDMTVLGTYWGIPAMLAGDIIGTSAQRLLAESSSDEAGGLKRVFRSAWSVHFFLVLVVGLVATVLLKPLNQGVFRSPALEQHLFLGLAIYVSTATIGFLRYALRGMQLFRATLSMDLTESIMRNSLWIFCCFEIGHHLTLIDGRAIAGLASMVVVYGLLIFDGYGPALQKWNPRERADLTHQAKAFSLIFFCNYVLNNLPIIVLNRFHGAADVGLYSALFKIVDFASAPVLTLAYVLAPVATGAKLKGEGQVNELLTKSFKLSIFFLPFIAALVICRTEIVNLFGLGGMAGAPEVMVAFCVFVFFSNLSAIFGSFADFLGYARARARLMTIFTVIYLISSVACAMYADVVLVAWLTTVTYSAMVVSYLWLIVRQHTAEFIRANVSFMGRVCVSFVIAAAIAAAIVPSPSSTRFEENLFMLTSKFLLFMALTVLFAMPLTVRRHEGRLMVR